MPYYGMPKHLGPPDPRRWAILIKRPHRIDVISLDSPLDPHGLCARHLLPWTAPEPFPGSPSALPALLWGQWILNRIAADPCASSYCRIAHPVLEIPREISRNTKSILRFVNPILRDAVTYIPRLDTLRAHLSYRP